MFAMLTLWISANKVHDRAVMDEWGVSGDSGHQRRLGSPPTPLLGVIFLGFTWKREMIRPEDWDHTCSWTEIRFPLCTRRVAIMKSHAMDAS